MSLKDWLPRKRKPQGDPQEIAGFDPEKDLPDYKVEHYTCNTCHGRGYIIVGKKVGNRTKPERQNCPACNS